jgi:hypothetical protein
MIPFLLLCFAAGIVIAVPVWIVFQRFGSRRGLLAARGFDPDDAVPCVIEPVALKGRLMPNLEGMDEGPASEDEGGTR